MGFLIHHFLPFWLIYRSKQKLLLTPFLVCNSGISLALLNCFVGVLFVIRFSFCMGYMIKGLRLVL